MEAKIYDMIARRFVAVFYPSAEFDITTRISTVAGHDFKTEGKVLTFPGWLAVYGKTSFDEAAPASPDSKTLPALDAADGAPPHAKAFDAQLHEESTRPPPRYTEATLLSAMEGAGKLVEDDELAEAMKERGLGTPATRAETIDGLINTRYIERHQRELVPTPKAEQILQFLTAVKAEAITSPAMTGEWEFKLRQMEHGKFPREKFMAEVVETTEGIVERVKSFEEDDSAARETDILSPTDGKPLIETLRGYKSKDGELMIYKVIGNRKMAESEVKDLLVNGQIGPLDGFRSQGGQALQRRPPLQQGGEEGRVRVRRAARRERRHQDRFHGARARGRGAVARASRRAARSTRPPRATSSGRVANGEDKVLARCSRRILSRDIPLEQFMKMLETGKTDLLEKFWSQRTRRPFSAFLALKEDGSTGFEFAPRAPKDPNAPARGRRGRKKPAEAKAEPPA